MDFRSYYARISILLECYLVKVQSVERIKITKWLTANREKALGYTIIEDISEQHKLKAYKEDFIGVASHKLKTPLTSLQASLNKINQVLVNFVNNAAKICP